MARLQKLMPMFLFTSAKQESIWLQIFCTWQEIPRLDKWDRIIPDRLKS